MQIHKLVGRVILPGRISKSETSIPRPVAGRVLLVGLAWASG